MRLFWGEVFSLLSSLCLICSTFGKNKNDIVKWQTVNTAFYSLANLFLGGYTAIVSNVLSMTRNVLQLRNALNPKRAAALCMLMAILGIASNNRGWLGVLPITASVSYTILLYYCKSVQAIQAAVIANMVQWAVFDWVICAYPSFIIDCIMVGMSAFNLAKAIPKAEK